MVVRTSLRTLAVRGSFWSALGFGTAQATRFASNLILTRLLFPEAFGLMALVQVVIQGLQMFSDTGVNASVVRDKHGDDEAYLNTAWTLQLVRGIGLWLAASLLARPAASFYRQPDLLILIPVVALRSAVMGASAPALLRLRRRIDIRPIVVRDISSQLISLVVMVPVALLWPSVWVLVLGTLAQAIVSTGLSYALPGPKPRLCWEQEALRSMFVFGRWVFLSTAITFLLQQGDKAVLGKFLASRELGIYAIAAFFSRTLIDGLLKINSQVVFPAYSRFLNEGRSGLRRQIFRVRLVLLCSALPLAWVLSIFGPAIINIAYDPRYHEAGWILRILAAGCVGAAIGTAAGPLLLAFGDSFRFMVIQSARGALLVACMFAGYYFGSTPGLVIGIAASRIVDYPVTAWATFKYGGWFPALDLAAVLSSTVIVGMGWFLL